MNNSRTKYITLCLLLISSFTLFSKDVNTETEVQNCYVNQYNVVWNTQSKNSGESMPVGGHSIGLNLWVENGEVFFYAQRSGSFTEHNEYHKLGRFRIGLTPNPFIEGASFRQELKLQEGYAEIEGKSDSAQAVLKVWCEVHQPVIHIDINSTDDIKATVQYESWRTNHVDIPNISFGPRWGCFSWEDYPNKVTRFADVVETHQNSILFYHRNRDDKLLQDYMLEQQHLLEYKTQFTNTQKGRTFGGMLQAEGFSFAGTDTGEYANTKYKAWKLKSDKAKKEHTIKIFTHIAQTATLSEWEETLEASAQNKSQSDKQRFEDNLKWWNAFWERSYIIIHPNSPDPKAWQLARNYQLFRYQMACNWYGEYPSKFNGGNFTFDPIYAHHKRKFTPDWRAWGGGSFTAQNQRLLYWPLLKTGDFESMLPQFEFYRRTLPNTKARVQKYWGHDGCLCAEQIENFGLPIACAWGWSEPQANRRKRKENTELGVLDNDYISYHYESQLEFSYMMLEYHRYSGADISTYIEFIKQSLIFFDEHYKMRHKKATGKELNEQDKLVIFPSTACETYKGAKNPSDVIAGMHACIDALLNNAKQYLSRSEIAYFEAYKKRIPAYAYSMHQGDSILLPAESWEKVQNTEIPQFYPLFPFNRFYLSSPNIDVFRNTWKHGTWDKTMVQSWHQDGIMYARMGMTNEAKEYNTKKLQDSKKRFPTFWGPGHDWTPDHNWGGSGMIGLQEMLMQTTGNKIHLLPAWPKEWNCTFKLHAPQKTIVEGIVKQGEITQLQITPQSRLKHVIIGNKYEH